MEGRHRDGHRGASVQCLSNVQEPDELANLPVRHSWQAVCRLGDLLQLPEYRDVAHMCMVLLIGGDPRASMGAFIEQHKDGTGPW